MKEKLKIAFDIDVALVHVWKEKKDARREEVEEFFRLISEKKEKLSIVIGTHVLNRIKSWKNKKIVERLEKLYSNYEIKDPEELILEFSSKLKKGFKEIVKDFSRKAEIKEEDAATLIAYSLLGIEYFVTLNKKHLRNKYAKIKTIGWEFGLKIPEIMLPSEFSLFLQRYASNQISASSPSKLPSNFNKVSFFSHKFKLDFTQFKSFLSKLFKKNHSSNRSCLPSFNPILLSGLNALKIFVLSILTLGIILPLSEAGSFIVYNVSNPLQTYFIVNGTTGYVGIGTGNPAYPLYVIGDVYWTGTLQNGIVPWARLQGYNLDVAWSGKLGWGNLTGYNLNVPWTGLLGWRNLTGYDLNVAWSGKLGWGNLTNYPAGCGPGQAVQAIGDTLTCINLNSTGNVTGVGTTNALTYWTSPNTIGALGFGTAGQFLKSQGSGNLPVWSTIYLGTDTEGNYVAGITAGTGIVVSGTPGEGWSPTVSIDTSIVPRKNVADTINAPWTFAENVWFNKNVFIAGNLSYVNVNTLNVNGSLIPIFSGQFDVGNSTYKWRNVTAVNIVGDNVYSGGNAVLTTATSFSNAAGSDITVSGNYNSLNLQINAGAVGTNELADSAVTTAKIADRNVTLAKLNQTSCPAGQALQSIGGGNYACVDVNPTGTITGSGNVGYIPLWNGTYSLNNSLISQSGGNVVINSGNLNIQSGGLLIGGTTVIDSSRNLTGINWVRQNLNFDIFRSANSYGIVWSGLTDSYKIYVNETAGSETTNLIIEYADNADSDNVIFRMVPHNAPAKNTLVLRYSDIIANATFRPLINNLIDLGTSSYQWANIYGVNIYASSSVRSAGGSASSPAFTFSSETNTGMYRVSNGTIGFSTGGTQRVTISSLGLNITYGGLQIGTYTVIDSSRNADFASLKIGGTNVIDSSRNIVNVNWVNATNIYASGTIYGNLGTIKKAVIYKFTTNGSLYIPANAYVFALLIGGGGGGGGGGDGFYDETRGTAWGGGGGGGGGGGAILYGYYYETSGQYISITVGNGGSGATTSGASGEAGGATKMTRGGVDIAIAGGGGGGKGGIGGAEGGYGGAGGIGGSTSSAPPFVVLLSIPGENGTPGEAGGINCGGRGGAGSNETIYQPVLFRPDGLFSLLPFSSEFLSFNSSALGGRGGSGACRLVAGGNGTNGSMPGAGGGGGGGGGASTLVPTEIGGSGGAGGAGGAGVAYIIVVT